MKGAWGLDIHYLGKRSMKHMNIFKVETFPFQISRKYLPDDIENPVDTNAQQPPWNSLS